MNREAWFGVAIVAGLVAFLLFTLSMLIAGEWWR